MNSRSFAPASKLQYKDFLLGAFLPFLSKFMSWSHNTAFKHQRLKSLLEHKPNFSPLLTTQSRRCLEKAESLEYCDYIGAILPRWNFKDKSCISEASISNQNRWVASASGQVRHTWLLKGIIIVHSLCQLLTNMLYSKNQCGSSWATEFAYKS